MSGVAAYHVFVCALFTNAGRYVDCQSTYLPALVILGRNNNCSLMMICDVLSKDLGAMKVFWFK